MQGITYNKLVIIAELHQEEVLYQPVGVYFGKITG